MEKGAPACGHDRSLSGRKDNRKGISAHFWFWAGMLLMGISVLPNLILGQESIFTYHDQLDGEMIAYILQAKHLFSGDVLPEFMGGMSKTALTLPAPVFVLLFLGGDYFAALTVMLLVGRLTGFAGMFLLVSHLTKRTSVAAAAGVLYGFLPFLPVYGLSQYGIPLLFWCGLKLREGKRLVCAYCATALFGFSSSLVLAGFGLLGVGVVVFLWDLFKKKHSWHFLAAWQLLLVVYVAENFRLLCQLAGIGDSFVSHKAEYVLNATPFWRLFWQDLFVGGQHSEGHHGVLLLVLLAVLAVVLAVCLLLESRASEEPEHFPEKTLGTHSEQSASGVRGERPERSAPGVLGRLPGETIRNLKNMGLCMGIAVCLALGAAFWGSSSGMALRGDLGTLGAFQLDRLLWMAPCLWYLAAACGFSALWSLLGQKRGLGRMAAGCGMAAVTLAAAAAGFRILMIGDIKSNIQKLRNPQYGLLSYSDYYAVGVMEQVRDFLAEQTGKGQDEYYVVSLGIDPAAALYHGFHSLDGYSNNYSLDYKHLFRRAIAPELDKSEYLESYFDTWGNRCYLFSAECPGYYTIEKNRFSFQEYQVDVDVLEQMGAEYLLSAAPIGNAGQQGLRLMRETPFETQDSYYQIYVYAIGG